MHIVRKYQKEISFFPVIKDVSTIFFLLLLQAKIEGTKIEDLRRAIVEAIGDD